MDHAGQALAQGEDADEELRQVAQTRLDEAGRARPETLANLLDGCTHQRGQGRQCGSGDQEPGHLGQPGELGDACDEGEQQGDADDETLVAGEGGEHDVRPYFVLRTGLGSPPADR